MPGHPDLVLAGRRALVFRARLFLASPRELPRNRTPKTRVEWWTAKFARNKTRDTEVRSLLEATGWRVFVIWECEAERAECLAALVAELKSIQGGIERMHP